MDLNLATASALVKFRISSPSGENSITVYAYRACVTEAPNRFQQALRTNCELKQAFGGYSTLR
jgi:hypothetical protein